MRKICIVGLGYVGLPLAIEFAKFFDTIGFDIDEKRIAQLKQGIDPGKEVDSKTLKSSKLTYSSDPESIKNSDFIIVAVPTPINNNFKPDLTFVESASKLVGKNIQKGSIVVYESTVYPGVTEEVCAPIIEKESKLKCGIDFKVGYSPERMNPGDKEHTVKNIIKIVSGMDKETLDTVAEVYERIVEAGVHKTKNIKTAEAAKAIENIQRDLNIALMNELSIIFHKVGINTKDVIDAAGSKWNFHKYSPGLVGGHCIGVDPYYITHIAEKVGYDPKVILAGRNINESMSNFVVELLKDAIKESKEEPKDILIMGVTFKENVNDIRNSKTKDVINKLKKNGFNVYVYDPLVEEDIIKSEFDVETAKLDDDKKFDSVILSVAHSEFKDITLEKIKENLTTPILIDLKSIYCKEKAKELGYIYRSL